MHFLHRPLLRNVNYFSVFRVEDQKIEIEEKNHIADCLKVNDTAEI